MKKVYVVMWEDFHVMDVRLFADFELANKFAVSVGSVVNEREVEEESKESGAV